MIEVNASRLVGELAAELPGAAQVFQRANIDFCCGGKLSLEKASVARGLDPNKVLAELEASASSTARADAPGSRWNQLPVQALISHIVEKHHAYVRRETPTLLAWLDKVVRVHGANHPELARVRHSFTAMASEMAQHMAKEELLLFPAIVKLASPNPPAAETSQAIAAPVAQMIREHDHTGNDLEQIRQASGDYTPPPDGCATYRALYQGLAAFESDMREHVHLENNVLFPRALALGQVDPHATTTAPVEAGVHE